MKRFIAFIIAPLLAQVFFVNAYATQTVQLEETHFYTPQLDTSFLNPNQRSNFTSDSEELLVRDYNLSAGFYAGYRSQDKQRLLFMSTQHSSGDINARILYFDEETQSVSPAFTMAEIYSESSSEIQILVGGQDIIGMLQSILQNPREITSEQLELQSFLTSKVGQAMLESIPVIYAELEAIDRYDSELAGLKAPFGAMRMALDVITGSYHGHRELRNMPLSDFAATNLVTQCESDICAYRTSQFIVHQYGLFDVLTDFDSLSHCQQNPLQISGSTPMGGITPMDYSNDCFGYCGPGCNTPGNVITAECAGHDQCVCEYSHTQCLLSSPSDCGDEECGGSRESAGHCNSLVSAVISYIVGLFGAGDDWDDFNVPDLPWENAPCDSISGCETCYYDIDCYPSYHIGV